MNTIIQIMQNVHFKSQTITLLGDSQLGIGGNKGKYHTKLEYMAT